MPRLSPAALRTRRLAREALAGFAWPVDGPLPIARIATPLLAEREAGEHRKEEK